MDRPATPEKQVSPNPARAAAPATPEATQRRAIREQGDAAAQRAAGGQARGAGNAPAGFIASNSVYVVGDGSAARKRPHAAMAVTDVPASSRNAAASNGPDNAAAALRPAKNFAKFVDYNFSAMTDTKGGFLSAEDDPWNKAFATNDGRGGGGNDAERPRHMSVAEWERMQVIRNLKRLKQGPYEPGLSVLSDKKDRKTCFECGSMEIDWVWEEVFGCRVCNACKEKHPDKYSLLTKTECKEDYFLTDPELKDAELLPHLSRPNPHKAHWHDMMLFLRYQVEEYAIGTKWGSAEALDAEFVRREADKKRRKEAKFKDKLLELKKKTRTEAYRRNARGNRGAAGESLATTFGDAVGSGGRHVHEWGRAVENEEGMSVKQCTTCGMEVEELEF
ncbi:DNA repair protein rad14 [Niveomyces insectorum RCEF 264]|uniref:DNA repair protein RAD14 n=1 Tax=Niveomyces insectorum RCEF 264 TaxID=1081102 RepID=A0A167Q941_9HYPO|nr:DNA repair protein rad14 [Niveomyces insectorum RCEF 264]